MEPKQMDRCRRRLNNRLPVIGGWLRRRCVRELGRDGSPEAVQALAGVVWRGADPSARDSAVEALCRLASGENRAAQEALCRYVVHHDDRRALREVRRAGYLPREESQRALFFFLTGQWKAYEELDFDHGLLQAVYEAAGPDLRRRITAKARDAGRLEWVGIAAGGRQGRRLGRMTEAEWKTALTVLDEHERWAELWRLAQDAPPRWAAAMLRRLAAVEWEPPPAEREDFTELALLARQWPGDRLRTAFDAAATLRGHADEVRCLAFHPRGDLIASGSADRTVRLWSLPDGRPLRTLEGHRGAVNCLSLSPDGRAIASGGRDGDLWVWRLPECRRAAHLKGHSQMVLCLAITPDSGLLVSGSADSAIQLWSLPDGKSLRMLDGHSSSVLALAVTPDGRTLASASADCSVRLWSLPDGRPLRVLRGHRDREADAVQCVAVSPDGQLLATGGTDGDVCLWTLPGGGALETLEGHLGPVSSLAVSPDGAVLASGSADQTIRLWRLPDGRALETWEAHSSEVTRLVASPDGQWLASASGNGLGYDHSVRLWSLPERRWVKSLYGHDRYVSCLAVSPDGGCLASCGGDGTVRLWGSELTRLCRVPVRQTTLKDLAWVQRAAGQPGLPDEERHALAFLAALIRRRHRHDVEVGAAVGRVIEVGEFDIEIEG
jgi:WD40 repeat protein